MNMRIIFLLLNFLVTGIVYAQQGYVEYGYVESLGLGNAKGIDYNATLNFDQKNSYYVTAKENLEKPEKINAQKIVEEDGQIKAIFNGMGVSKQGNEVYYSRETDLIFSNLHFGKDIYLVKDSATKCEWIISKESKKIGRFDCTKATTNFRGRNYVVWYTTDIPVPYGPWKLKGLPGLIIEAYDIEKFVFWYFKNLEIPTNRSFELNNFQVSDLSKYKTYPEYKKNQLNILKKREEKNAILMQQNNGLEITSPKLNELFVECE